MVLLLSLLSIKPMALQLGLLAVLELFHLGGHLNNAISLYHVFSVFLACIIDLVLRSDLISKLICVSITFFLLAKQYVTYMFCKF